MKQFSLATATLVLLLLSWGCAPHADLLSMRKVTLEIDEGSQTHISRVHVYAVQRGLLVSGELVASGSTRQSGIRLYITLSSPMGEVLAETHSPALYFPENPQGTIVPKRTFSIPIHTRAPEGSVVKLRVAPGD